MTALLYLLIQSTCLQRMDHQLLEADAAMFYDADSQSSVASLAVGEGKLCIFSEWRLVRAVNDRRC